MFAAVEFADGGELSCDGEAAIRPRGRAEGIIGFGPAAVMVHSQSGNFGFTAALNAPDKVRAVIGIEPSGTPLPDQVDVSKVRDIPHLVVWGDFIEEGTRWPGYQERVKAYRDALAAAGGSLDIVDLPALGIRGNSHFPMMDDNSDAVASLVQDWIESKGLMR